MHLPMIKRVCCEILIKNQACRMYYEHRNRVVFQFIHYIPYVQYSFLYTARSRYSEKKQSHGRFVLLFLFLNDTFVETNLTYFNI